MDRTRRQLQPIRTLTALSDSFARESRHFALGFAPEHASARGSRRRRFGESPLEVAYLTRWIELDAGRELHGWRTLCQRVGS